MRKRTHSRGVVYIAFGPEYVKVAAASAASFAEHAQLPVHVITNCNPEAQAWPPDTTFQHMDLPDGANREIRTSLVDYTPFDRTLLLDADTFVTSPNIALPFRYLDNFDMCLLAWVMLENYKRNDQWKPICQSLGTMAHFALVGGVIYFRKNGRVQEFFRKWQSTWRDDGCARDMPPLFNAVWNSRVRYLALPGMQGWMGRTNGFIRHDSRQAAAGLPRMKYKVKPNGLDDQGNRRRWIKVTPDGKEYVEPPTEVTAPLRPSIAYVGERFGIGTGVVGAEIGVNKGYHAASILKHLDPMTLYLVDPWEGYPEYSSWVLRYCGRKKWLSWKQTDWESRYQITCDRFKDDPRVKIIRAKSLDAIELVPDDLHFAYIDGNHDETAVHSDLMNWWPRIRSGGVLCGHDYEPKYPGVMSAVQMFAEGLQLYLHHDETDFWLLKP